MLCKCTCHSARVNGIYSLYRSTVYKVDPNANLRSLPTLVKTDLRPLELKPYERLQSHVSWKTKTEAETLPPTHICQADMPLLSASHSCTEGACQRSRHLSRKPNIFGPCSTHTLAVLHMLACVSRPALKLEHGDLHLDTCPQQSG